MQEKLSELSDEVRAADDFQDKLFKNTDGPHSALFSCTLVSLMDAEVHLERWIQNECGDCQVTMLAPDLAALPK